MIKFFALCLLLQICVVLSATISLDFQISWIDANPDGVPRKVIGINGRFPGPTIVANLSDTIEVNVTNVDIVNGTSIHWHGMYQRGTPFMDGTSWVSQCPIPPGGSYTYRFLANQTGSYWYHGHTMTNYVDGLYGAFIIQDPADPYASSYDDELIMLVGDWHHHIGFDLLATFMSNKNPSGEEPSPNSILVNGVGQANCSDLNAPLISEDSGSDEGSDSDGGGGDDDDDGKGWIRPKKPKNTSIYANSQNQLTSCNPNMIPASFSVTAGKRYRLRIINTSAFTHLVVSIDGHALTVIEADATPTEMQTVDQISIDVAQRYSVLFNANQTSGRYTIRVSADPVMGFNLSGMALIQYDGIYGEQVIGVSTPSNPSTLEPFSLRPYSSAAAPGPVVMTIQLDMDFSDDSKMVNMAYINNQTYMASSTPALYTAYHNQQFPSNGNVYTIPSEGVVEIILNNRDEGDHPFHLHGHRLAVLSIGNPGDGDYNPNNSSQVINSENPLWRDVVTVHQNSYLLLRIMADNPGVWLMHCHIEWHMEAGLALLINELPNSQLSAYEFPEFVPSQCTSPVAPPDMMNPSSYGGTFLGAASSLGASSLFIILAVTFSLLLF